MAGEYAQMNMGIAAEAAAMQGVVLRELADAFFQDAGPLEAIAEQMLSSNSQMVNPQVAQALAGAIQQVLSMGQGQ